MKKIFCRFANPLSILMALISFIITLNVYSPAFAANNGLKEICVPQPKFAYLFKNLSNFQSNISPLTGNGSCQWNVNGIQTVSFTLTENIGKYSQQRTLNNLTHADPFDRYVDADPNYPPQVYEGHFAVSVCATTQLACVEHVVIDSDRLLDIKDITQSSAALDYFSIRRNLETIGLFIAAQYRI